LPNNKRKVNYYWGKSIWFYDGIFDLFTILNFQIPMKRKREINPAYRVRAHGIGGIFISLYRDEASLVSDIFWSKKEISL